MRLKTLLLATAIAFVPVPSSRALAQDARQEVMRLEDTWAKASMMRDGKAVEALLAPEFTWVSPGGDVFDKAQLVKMISDDQAVYVSGRNTEYAPHVHGNVVVITGLWTVTTRTPAGNKTVQRRWIDTWIKGADGQWRCVGGQSGTVAAK
jgi:ketosteroid isomerase-like protein